MKDADLIAKLKAMPDAEREALFDFLGLAGPGRSASADPWVRLTAAIALRHAAVGLPRN